MLNLTVAVTRNPRFEPLIDGTITSKLVNLQFVVTTPPELFYRNLKYDEFDVFEMSLSELAITRESGTLCRYSPPRRSSGWGYSQTAQREFGTSVTYTESVLAYRITS